MEKNGKLIEFKVSKEQSKVVHERVKPFLAEHIASQKSKALSNEKYFPLEKDIRWLALCCYMQGLRDGEQVMRQNKGL